MPGPAGLLRLPGLRCSARPCGATPAVAGPGWGVPDIFSIETGQHTLNLGE
jgi:hypothetical protein